MRQKTLKKLLPIVACMAFVINSNCSIKLYSGGPGPLFNEITNIPKGYAVVYFVMCPKLYSCANLAKIIGRSEYGYSYFFKFYPKGEHCVKIFMEALSQNWPSEPLTMNIEPGKSYYVGLDRGTIDHTLVYGFQESGKDWSGARYDFKKYIIEKKCRLEELPENDPFKI